MPVKALGHLVRPTARALSWLPPIAAAALAFVIVGWALHREAQGPMLVPALRYAVLILAMGSAMALVDEAAVAVAASPISLGWRRLVRLALTVTAAAAGWLVCLGLAAWAGGSVPMARLSLEGLAILAAASGLAVVFGPAFGMPILAGLVVIAPGIPGVAERWDHTIGRIGDGTRQWLLILAAATVVVALDSRDPARRGTRYLNQVRS